MMGKKAASGECGDGLLRQKGLHGHLWPLFQHQESKTMVKRIPPLARTYLLAKGF